MLNWEIVIFILLLLHVKLYLLADVFLFGRNNLFVYFWRCIFKQMYFADEEPPCENAIKYHHYYYYYYYYFISLVQHIFVADGSLVNIFRKNFFDLAATSLEIETERDFYSLQELCPFIYSVKAVNVTWSYSPLGSEKKKLPPFSPNLYKTMLLGRLLFLFRV